MTSSTSARHSTPTSTTRADVPGLRELPREWYCESCMGEETWDKIAEYIRCRKSTARRLSTLSWNGAANPSNTSRTAIAASGRTRKTTPAHRRRVLRPRPHHGQSRKLLRLCRLWLRAFYVRLLYGQRPCVPPLVRLESLQLLHGSAKAARDFALRFKVKAPFKGCLRAAL